MSRRLSSRPALVWRRLICIQALRSGESWLNDIKEDSMRDQFRQLCGILLLGSFFFLFPGCAAEEEVAEPVTETTATQPAAEASGPATLSEGFETPESVLYDADQDVYFVSNINGSPVEADGNGFISRISAADRSVESKWIDGATEGVTLNAPKGLAIVGNELWVTDITTVRRFDRRSGASLGEIAIEGSGFLNDLASAPDGGAYLSDSGLSLEGQEFMPSGTDAIYRIAADGTVEKLASGDELTRPNGVVAGEEGVWVVTFGGNQLYRIAGEGKTDLHELPQGSLDGLVLLPDGAMLVSSWDASAVFRGSPGGPFEPVIENVESPADIGFDSKRNLVLIPHFMENRISLHPLP